jgi:hypothetical protein
VQHWDKIVFKINSTELAKRVNLTAGTELDIKVLDNPKEVADIKKKNLTFWESHLLREKQFRLWMSSTP